MAQLAHRKDPDLNVSSCLAQSQWLVVSFSHIRTDLQIKQHLSILTDDLFDVVIFMFYAVKQNLKLSVRVWLAKSINPVWKFTACQVQGWNAGNIGFRSQANKTTRTEANNSVSEEVGISDERLPISQWMIIKYEVIWIYSLRVNFSLIFGANSDSSPVGFLCPFSHTFLFFPSPPAFSWSWVGSASHHGDVYTSFLFFFLHPPAPMVSSFPQIDAYLTLVWLLRLNT